jgi:hypothetical protein
MKQKTKRIIGVCFAVLLAVALCGWYFYPVYMYKFWFYKFHSLRHYLEMTPVEITALNPPPKEWTTISIGGLILMLPMSRYKNVQGREIYPNLYCTSETGSLLIFEIAPPWGWELLEQESKLPPYQEELAIFKSTPADISVFNSRSKNIRAFINQILKAVSIPVYGSTKILAVNTGTLKAICNISEKRKKGYTAIVRAFNQNETVSVNVMLKDYKEIGLLESDLFEILAGIRMSDRRSDKKEVERDIKSIVAKFKKKT